ncbi:hypothetical protein DFJ74DRAFT_650528 [Hyaloraphidium curvatum]|nr:hypothetical protein DFJ74DRAFT_698304 [Hyaloraphidium curvatum]KAI9033055.1 hypothetical protein DFJ74DRAFT_650528 [Hyaloraphidium curvatum]
MEQRTAEAEALEPAQGTESASESASAPPSPPLSPSTGPNPADPSRCASPLDALIPPYTMRTPPPDPAPLAPRGRTIKKSTIEKRRRDAFAAELRLLAAAVPGASSATRSSVVLRARDYIVRLAARERLLRRLVLEGRAEGMGLDLADGEKMAGLLAELERELRTGP